MKFVSQQNNKPTHAGGIIYREENGHKEFLLISARNLSFIWVLPKGHIKFSETEIKAAIREVKEETGMSVSVVKKIGNSKRLRWNFKKQVVAFYLMKFESVSSYDAENRKLRWLPLEEAIRKLFYSDQKKILKQIQFINFYNSTYY